MRRIRFTYGKNSYQAATIKRDDIFRRARNSKKPSKAKHASVSDYNASTGFEAVIGYLYLIGDYDRLDEIFNYAENIDL